MPAFELEMKISLPIPMHTFSREKHPSSLTDKVGGNYGSWQSGSCHKNISDGCLYIRKTKKYFFKHRAS